MTTNQHTDRNKNKAKSTWRALLWKRLQQTRSLILSYKAQNSSTGNYQQPTKLPINTYSLDMSEKRYLNCIEQMFPNFYSLRAFKKFHEIHAPFHLNKFK
jgi:hypothetical protein